MFSAATPDLNEYWVGYFRADGSIWRSDQLRKTGIFGQVRFHPVNELASYINRPGRVISRAQTTNFGFCVTHTIKSAQLGYYMDEVGAKSTLRPDLYRSWHFWRGMVDGDGCLLRYKTRTKTPGSWSPGLSILLNESDAKAFKQLVFDTLDGFDVYVQKTNSEGMFQASLCGNRAKLLVHLMYENEYSANTKKTRLARETIERPWSTHHQSWRPLDGLGSRLVSR